MKAEEANKLARASLENNKERRYTGRTTQQMQDAPEGAVYVWCNGCLNYPKTLAKRLGRDDLIIVPPNQGQIWGAITGNNRALVKDHALALFTVDPMGVDAILYGQCRKR